jgi:hypothetical protein
MYLSQVAWRLYFLNWEIGIDYYFFENGVELRNGDEEGRMEDALHVYLYWLLVEIAFHF